VPIELTPRSTISIITVLGKTLNRSYGNLEKSHTRIANTEGTLEIMYPLALHEALDHAYTSQHRGDQGGTGKILDQILQATRNAGVETRYLLLHPDMPVLSRGAQYGLAVYPIRLSDIE
jgi:hypothetical protein